jgi:hypothetical protein
MVLRGVLGRFSRATKPDNPLGGPFELVNDLTHLERRFQPVETLSLPRGPSDIVREGGAGEIIEILPLFL